MGGVTSWQMDVTLMRAVLGDEGAIAELRRIVALVDTGKVQDPSQIRQPPPSPKPPSPRDALTNALLDGREQQATRKRGPVLPGTREWLAAQREKARR
jgi:hypothetical protein